MTTGFAVEPAQVAGFGEMAGGQGRRMFALARLVDEARLTEVVHGLPTSCQGPFDAYTDAAKDRVFDQAVLLTGLAETLDRACWVYTGQEKATYRDMRDVGGHPTAAIPIRDFPSPAHYAAGSAPDVPAPGHDAVGLKEVAENIDDFRNMPDEEFKPGAPRRTDA